MIKKRGDDFKMGPKYIEIYDLVQASPDEYLMHHGIKNQKWGVRRGPPYPLQSGIRTKIKKVTNAAKERSKENQAKRAARTAAKKEAAAAAKERKQAAAAEKKETLQDKINKMTDEELIARTQRLKLENAYRKELPHEEKGKNFIEKGADVFNTLKTGTEAVTSFIKATKDLGKVLGLVEDKPKNETSLERLPGESIQDYSKRLASLASIKKNKESLSSNEMISPSKEADKNTSTSEKTSTSKQTSTPKATSTAKKPSLFDNDFSWSKDYSGDNEYSALESLRTEGKKWGIDVDKPLERSWTVGNSSTSSTSTARSVKDFSNSGSSFLKDLVNSGDKVLTYPEASGKSFDNWEKDDPDKKKKGG